MKLISLDGSQGTGKTSLSRMLATFFKNSIAFPVSTTSDKYSLIDINKDEDVYHLADIYSDCINDTRRLFESGKADMKKISDTMQLLYTTRLLMIESYKPLQKYDYVFVDSYWDPLPRFESKMVRRTFDSMKKLLKFPHISFFLQCGAKKAFRRRMGESNIEEFYTEEDYKDIEKKSRYFLKFMEEKKINMHELDARQPLSEVYDRAIRIITNTKGEEDD